MKVPIGDFHNHYTKYFDAALNGELVWIVRGGVLYRLMVELPGQHQLKAPKEKQDDEEE